MQRWKLTLQYDGSDFHGWQAQNGYPSVQSTLEHALRQLCQQDIRVYVAGRTDAGVHALAQVVHTDIPRPLPAAQMRLALQAYLPREAIAVIAAEPVAQDFHARFSATARHYQYRLICCPTPRPLLNQRVWWLPKAELNIQAMQKAANDLIGQHDFTSFRAAGCQANGPIRRLDRAHISLQEHLGMSVICCDFSARSFLYHQVRNMVGTLVAIGEGRRPLSEVSRLLQLKDRTQAAPTAPAHGLYFVAVDY